MKCTKLGKSKPTVSCICLGIMHFGGRTPDEEAFMIMDRARAESREVRGRAMWCAWPTSSHSN
jgi:hypothetical protein